MKFFIFFLLGTALGIFEDMDPPADFRRRMADSSYDVKVKNKKCMANFKADNRSSCNLVHDVASMDKAVRLARGIVNNCPVADGPRSIVIVRHLVTDSMIYTTETPRKAYSAMMSWILYKSNLDSKHKILLHYQYKTRDGKSRKLIIKGDMDLWAAFLLQQANFTVEINLTVSGTTQPSNSPTTATPTAVPTTAMPTVGIISKIINPNDELSFLNGMISSLRLKLNVDPCYRMSRDGKNQATFRTKCGYGMGPWMLIIKATTGHIFGAYNDLNWTNNGGTYFYCRECFMWILKGKDTKWNQKKMTQYRYLNYATYHHTSYGPCFGGGHDLCINSPSTPSGYANTGYTYKAEGGSYPYYITTSSSGFKIEEWEVYPAVPLKSGDFYTRIINQETDREWLKAQLPDGKKLGTRCWSMYYGIGHTSKATSYFRNSCSGRSPIMFTARVGKEYIFGGYSGIQWSKSTSGYAKSADAFLWILKGIKHTRKKIGQNGKTPQYATYHHTSYGPCFGSGHDMCVSSPGSPSGYAKIGSTYTPPSGSNPYYITSTSSASWTLADWEVHFVVDE